MSSSNSIGVSTFPNPRIYLDPFEGESLPGAGMIPSDKMIIGIAPSPNRPKERKLEPFGAGSWRMISSLSKRAPEMYVTNLVKTPVPPGTKLRIGEIRKWLPVLYHEIELVQPSRILTLGTEPAKVLCPGFKDLRGDHGTFFFNQQINAYVIPTYHFSAAYRSPGLQPLLSRDLERFFTLPDPEPAAYKLINDFDEFPVPRDPENRRLFLDVETTGLTIQDTVEMIGLKWQHPSHGVHGTTYVKEHPDRKWIEEMLSSLSRWNCLVVGHNLPFDLMMLSNMLGGKFPKKFRAEDTLLQAHILGEGVLTLKALTTRYTDLPGSRSGGGFTDPLYQAEDVRSTEAINYYFRDSEKTFIHPIIADLVVPVSQMRQRGVYIDQDILGDIERQVAPQIERTSEILKDMAGDENFNPGSSQQVAKFLIEKAELNLTEQTKSGNWSVSEKVLVALGERYENNQALSTLLQHRALGKLASGFVEPYREFASYDGLLHPTLKLFGTRTGRTSCADPNLQQVPREGPLKTMFVPRPGFEAICLCDLSQAELRVAALLADDDAMVDALLSEDFHRRVASIVFKKPEAEITSSQRKWSKRVTFGILYGGSAKGLAWKFAMEEEEISAIIKMMMAEFKGLAKWLKGMRYIAEHENVITSIFGRRRDLKALRDDKGAKDAYRKAVNTPVQATASDLILIVKDEVNKQLAKRKMRTRPLMVIHDSLMTEVANGETSEMPEVLHCGFQRLNETPMNKLRLFGKLPIIGDMALGESWAACESTAGPYYNPRLTYDFSTHANKPIRTKAKAG